MAFNTGAKLKQINAQASQGGKNILQEESNSLFLLTVSVWGFAYINVPETEQHTSRKTEVSSTF